MQLLLRLVVVVGVFLGISERVQASDSPVQQMYVQISNQTGIDCTLLSQKIIHGDHLLLSLPESLPVNQVSSFALGGSFFHGPDEVLNYQCGSSTVKFEVSQPVAVLSGVTPIVNVIESHGLTAETVFVRSLSFVRSSSGRFSLLEMITIALKSIPS